MLTEYETQKLQDDFRRDSNLNAKQRLLRDMRHEPAWRFGVLLKCAACLLILAGLALIGKTDLESAVPLHAPAASARHPASGAVRDAKQAFDEAAEVERTPPVSKGTKPAGEDYAPFKAEHHRKALFDERRRAWEQQRYGEDKRIARGKDAP